jgi:hypothetical protein
MKVATGEIGEELEPGGESYLRLGLGREFSAQGKILGKAETLKFKGMDIRKS